MVNIRVLVILCALLASGLFSMDQMEYEKKRCDIGDSTSCLSLGNKMSFYNSPIGFQNAAKYYKKACDNNNENGCVALGKLYLYGKGVSKDPRRALSLFSKGCKYNSEGCLQVAKMHDFGLGIPKNEKLAMEFYAKSTPEGKAIYADKLLEKKQYSEALSICNKLCEEGIYTGCAKLGRIYELGLGVAPDAKTAIGYYEKYIGYYSDSFDNEEKRQAVGSLHGLFKAGCDNGNASYCYELGYSLKMRGTNEEKRKNRDESVVYLKKACELGKEGACWWLRQ